MGRKRGIKESYWDAHAESSLKNVEEAMTATLFYNPSEDVGLIYN